MSTRVTKRIGGSASQDVTRRVNATFPTSLLLLSGDEAGYLYLSGDAKTDELDKLRLSGDQVDAVTGTTPRVTGAITSHITKRLG